MAKRRKTGKKGARKGKKLGKNFWIGLGVVVVVVLLIIVLFTLYSGEKAEEEEKEIGDEGVYYGDLEGMCGELSVTQVGCCVESANIMKARGYQLVGDDGECPEGFKNNTIFRCAGSYEWCEPA